MTIVQIFCFVFYISPDLACFIAIILINVKSPLNSAPFNSETIRHANLFEIGHI